MRSSYLLANRRLAPASELALIAHSVPEAPGCWQRQHRPAGNRQGPVAVKPTGGLVSAPAPLPRRSRSGVRLRRHFRPTEFAQALRCGSPAVDVEVAVRLAAPCGH